ncbi:MAG: hypothetical protein ACU83N_16490 [Gammaproteobacteria bacterium]
MLTALKKILILVLALLQLMAPLVHAHIADDRLGVGLHIPGLEHYNVASDAPEIKALAHDAASDNLVIGIDSGIRLDLNDNGPLQDQACFLDQGGFPENRTLLSHQINFSPHQPPSISFVFASSPQSPRAPPVSN